MENLNTAILGRVPLAVPPISEQRAIADWLDAQTAQLDELSAKAEGAIDKLTEYRAALITAAVTGKIDVRGASATLRSA